MTTVTACALFLWSLICSQFTRSRSHLQSFVCHLRHSVCTQDDGHQLLTTWYSVCSFTFLSCSTSLSFSSWVFLQPRFICNKQADMCTVDHCSAAGKGLERSCVCSMLWLTMWVVWWYVGGSLPHVVELNGEYLRAIGCCDNSWRRPTWPKRSVYWLLLLQCVLDRLLTNTPRFSG